MQLSKSDYMLFLKHPAWLWVKKIDPKKIPPIDENTKVIFDDGHRFESYIYIWDPIDRWAKCREYCQMVRVLVLYSAC